MGTCEIGLCSLLIVLPCIKFFWRFLRHIGKFLDHFGGVDTPAGRVPVPRKPGQVEQIHVEWGGQYLRLLLGFHAPLFFWRFLRHIGTFLEHLRGVDTPMGIALTPKSRPKLSKYMGGAGRSISQLLLGPHAPHFFWRFLRHIGIFQTTWKVLTHLQVECQCPKLGQVKQIHGGVGRSISQLLLAPHAPIFFGGS